MEELLLKIEEKLQSAQGVNWLIVHELVNIPVAVNDIKFSFVDGKEDLYEPFKVSPGYVTLNTAEAYQIFSSRLIRWLKTYRKQIPVLAQLYALVSRINHPQEQLSLQELFKSALPKKWKTELYGYMIATLNGDYFKHLHYSLKEITNVEDWLTLIRSAQYRHHIADPLLAVLHLVKIPGRHLSYSLIEDMAPMLRSTLIGWYGYEIRISVNERAAIYGNPNERMFLTAILLESGNHTDTPPSWLKYPLIEKTLDTDWETVGQYLFPQIYGLNFRKRQQNKVHQAMKKLTGKFLRAKLSQKETAAVWISRLEFPKHFIAVCSWLIEKPANFGKLPDHCGMQLLDQFLSELNRIGRQIPELIAEKNSSDPFLTSYVGENQYLTAIAYALILLLDTNEAQLKLLKKTYFTFKPLFYGGYRSKYLATRFAEIQLLIALSGPNLTNISNDRFLKLNELLQIISDTILIPYIHLTEREEDIWNPDYEFGISLSNMGRQQINAYLKKILTSSMLPYYQTFVDRLSSIKTAEWPYERL
ncbi:hypothetical protein [Mucilaginibacter segetis]|uniref:Uncharacterized protein n=1 Tax=Mucilaginibacter segetis TaxID=2793071 RepID=A0A934PTI1_9SPHI|nr:hypothetical protein [Mucilaginibacter segetis]MBK0379307.1 hypothetical protein [Mucilaginibacter segetis]